MSESLRDQLEKIVESKELEIKESSSDDVSRETPPVDIKAEAPPQDIAPQETAEAKAERLRDEAGRFVAKTDAVTQPVTPQEKPRPQRPNTWKKEHWESYDKLAAENPQLAEYILQRESEFTKGVSTYKQEWDRAKPLLEAMAEFQPLLQQHNIEPTQWIRNLGHAHRMLATGTPEQRLQMFHRLAQDYQVPLQALVGAQGQYTPPPQPAIDPNEIDRRIEARLREQATQAEINAFASNKEKYPHFEEVRDTMAGLLQSGLAEGLGDAYEAALRHPRHATIFTSLQEQQRQSEDARAAEERRKQAELARRKAVSPRSTTPTASSASGNAPKGIRASIESAFDSVAAGRI